MRKWIINMGILTGIWLTLAGCGAPKAQVIMEAETAAADRTETQAGQELLGDPKERAEETVSFLEQFESSLSFRDMDRERAAAYGGPLEDSYAFYGRETEDGAGLCPGDQNTEGEPSGRAYGVWRGRSYGGSDPE